MSQNQHQFARLLAGLGIVLMWMPGRSLAVDPYFDLLQTKTAVYSNVTVTTRSKDYIVIQHARGLVSLKAAELPAEVQQALGFGNPKSSGIGGFIITAKAKSLVENLPTQQIKAVWNKHVPPEISGFKPGREIIYILLGAIACGYLWFSICGALICQKIGRPAGVLIWIPLLQFIPLFRAAKMSPLWMLGMMVPLLNIWGHIIWSFRIASLRGRGFGTALLLILPTYPLVFTYLAFARNIAPAEAAAPPEKFKSTGLVLDAG